MSKDGTNFLDEDALKMVAKQLRLHLEAVEGGEIDFTSFIVVTQSTCSDDDCSTLHFRFSHILPDELPGELYFTMLRGLLQRALEETAMDQRRHETEGALERIMTAVHAEIAKEEGSIQ